MKNILKKFSFFAMLVAIISSAISVTSIAEEHVHEAVTRGDIECWYEIVDDIYHVERLGYDEICSCGVVIRKRIRVEATHEHVYNGDVCKYCKYTKVHTHQGVSKGNKVTTLKSYDENTHTYSIAYENLCSCGEVVCLIDETINTASHTFKNGKCVECGYKHTHKDLSKGNKVTTLKSYNETTHTYSVAYESVCSCGKVVGLVDETTKTSDHSFENDKCVECGYQKNHTHEGSALGEKIEWYEKANEDGHTFVIANESLCSCGEVVELVDRVEKHESHTFSGDECTKCGYVTKNTMKDEQSILGDFFKDVNVDGDIAQIVVGEISDAGLVVEVNSLLVNKNIAGDNFSESVPLIGSLKYKDKVYAVVKNVNELENIIENEDGSYKIARPLIKVGAVTAEAADVACTSDNFAVLYSELGLHTKSSTLKFVVQSRGKSIFGEI